MSTTNNQAGAGTSNVVSEVPETLKRLVLVLAKVFYSPQHYVLLDYLQRNVCLREDRLREFLKFEPKPLKQLLVNLKVDKFITERLVADDHDGRSKKINYYHVNYKGILNVTKYKIDHIRMKLETREQDNSRKASYVCSGCQKHYDALDIGQIYNVELQQMICWNCNQKVVTDKTSGPTEETRNLLAKFNDDMAGIFSMLQQMDGIRFARHIIEPPIKKDDPIAESKEPAQVLQLGQRKFNVEEQNRSSMFSNGITVSIGEATEDQIEAKSAVPWLQHSTYDYDNQPTTSFAGPSHPTNGNSKENKLNGISGDSMEVDEEDGLGFTLDQIFNISRHVDIGQLLLEFEGGGSVHTGAVAEKAS